MEYANLANFGSSKHLVTPRFGGTANALKMSYQLWSPYSVSPLVNRHVTIFVMIRELEKSVKLRIVLPL